MFHNIFNIIPLVNEHFDPENHQFLSGNNSIFQHFPTPKMARSNFTSNF